jgi:uncharacterized coiled-coil protein SlyX
MSEQADVHERIRQLEIKLLEQEHRIIPIAQNLISTRTTLRDDPDKKNAGSVHKSVSFP